MCVTDALAKRNVLTTRLIIEAASGCRIAIREQGDGAVCQLGSADRKARRAAAIYICYRSSLDKSANLRTRAGGFRMELLDATNARAIYLPPRYDLRSVREVLFRDGALYSKSKEVGVLVDVTSLDSERKIQLLSTMAKNRDAMVSWIISTADTTLPPPPEVEVVAVVAAPAAVREPSLSDLLAQRTVDALVTAGFDAARAHRMVGTLADKGDVAEAMNRMLDLDLADSYAHVAVSLPPAGQSETSSLSDASTNLETLVLSPDGPSRATAWPELAPPLKACSDASGSESDQPTEERASAECVVCLAATACHAFLPCGHMVACAACAHQVFTATASCPMCRAPSTAHLRIFMQ